ncbi:MAG: cytochrome c [Pseudomonadota bacterium]
MVLAAMLCMVWPMNALAQEQSDAAFEAQLVAKGQALVEEHCAQCHAIGRRDTSSHAEAPPFREVVQRYPPEQLAEAFAEGIQTGHPDMPIFIFEPEQIGTLIVYLNTLIEPEPGSATE